MTDFFIKMSVWWRNVSTSRLTISAKSPEMTATANSIFCAVARISTRRLWENILISSFLSLLSLLPFIYIYIFINWFIKYYMVVTSEAQFLPRDCNNHPRYSLHLPMEGRPGWVDLIDQDKYRSSIPPSLYTCSSSAVPVPFPSFAFFTLLTHSINQIGIFNVANMTGVYT